MVVLVEDYEHRTGEHCASTALRNILHHRGLELSEAMIVGLSGGVGFFYLRSGATSPSAMFHGRTASLEVDFCRNLAIPFEDREVDDDARAWEAVRERIDAGQPVMVSTDTFYLGYQNTTSHFPGHRAVVVGYDAAARTALIADRKFDEYQVCSLDELRRARNSDDYPVSCRNQFGDFLGDISPGRPLAEAIRIAIRRNADWMLARSDNRTTGIDAMRDLAADFPRWQTLEDWSWAARFGYQVVIKRGAGGSFFRSLYADFLDEAAQTVPALSAAGPQMATIAARWRELAAVLKEQSERESCDPELFRAAGGLMTALADEEGAFFARLKTLSKSEAVWAKLC